MKIGQYFFVCKIMNLFITFNKYYPISRYKPHNFKKLISILFSSKWIKPKKKPLPNQ